jgi:hypothetical protein
LFSKAKIAARQGIIQKNVDKLCQRISTLAGTTFNLGAATSAFTRDIANEFIIGKEYNELDSEDFNVGLSISSAGAGSFWRTTKFIRWFGPALRAVPIDWVMKSADENTKSFLRYLQVSCLPSAHRKHLAQYLCRHRPLTCGVTAMRTRHPGHLGCGHVSSA